MAVDDLQDRLPRHLKLRELRVLLAVAEQGSFRKAGRLLHLTQPAVTAAIAELESTLGVALFNRTASGVTPTAHGDSFIARANAIFGELRLAAEDLEIISRGSRGTLRVGVGGGGWGLGILPAALNRLLDPHPEAFILIKEADEDLLVELLKARELDLFLSRLTPPSPDPALAYRPLLEDSICVFASRTHPLAGRKRVRWDEIAGERWVVPPPGALSFDHVQRTLHKAGLTMPRHVIQSTSASFAFGMLLQGNFLCFGTWLHYESSVLKPLLTVLPLELPKVTVALGMVILKDRALNPLGARLAGLIEELAQSARRDRQARTKGRASAGRGAAAHAEPAPRRARDRES